MYASTIIPIRGLLSWCKTIYKANRIKQRVGTTTHSFKKGMKMKTWKEKIIKKVIIKDFVLAFVKFPLI